MHLWDNTISCDHPACSFKLMVPGNVLQTTPDTLILFGTPVIVRLLQEHRSIPA
jgi:hypothetical protein